MTLKTKYLKQLQCTKHYKTSFTCYALEETVLKINVITPDSQIMNIQYNTITCSNLVFYHAI